MSLPTASPEHVANARLDADAPNSLRKKPQSSTAEVVVKPSGQSIKEKRKTKAT